MRFGKYENIVVNFEDNTQWVFPIEVIAFNRADHYKDEYGGDLERSLKEDTALLFEEDIGEALEWFRNNMDWKDVEDEAYQREIVLKTPNYHHLISTADMDFE